MSFTTAHVVLLAVSVGNRVGAGVTANVAEIDADDDMDGARH